MQLLLIRGKDHSYIVLNNGVNDVDQINYGRRIHKYESESDFKTLKTELATYGEKAMMQVWDYFKQSRVNA